MKPQPLLRTSSWFVPFSFPISCQHLLPRSGTHFWLWCLVYLSNIIGCTHGPYRYGVAKHYHHSEQLAAMTVTQIERGKPNKFVDGVGWVVGIPSKIILWDRRIDNHRVSADTEDQIQQYLDANELTTVKVRLNQYAPGDEWRRLVANKSVGAGWRYTLGVLSVAGYTLLPGRIVGGDNYNPFTNTIHIYSDAPAIALHEGGHAKDFSSRSLPGTYAALYVLVPFAPLYHEAIATQDALAYLREEGTLQEEQEAYRLLYPAYGTYVGGLAGGPVTQLGAVVAGHILGRVRGGQLPQERSEEPTGLALRREQKSPQGIARQSAGNRKGRHDQSELVETDTAERSGDSIAVDQSPPLNPSIKSKKSRLAEPLDTEVKAAGFERSTLERDSM